MNLFTIMHNATASGIKHPKVRINESVTLTLMPKGYIAIQANGIYVGKITGDLEIHLYEFKGLREQISQVIQDPVYFSKVYGQKTGNCCFCGRKLENHISVYHGYGPICADNFGLPWIGQTVSPESFEL